MLTCLQLKGEELDSAAPWAAVTYLTSCMAPGRRGVAIEPMGKHQQWWRLIDPQESTRGRRAGTCASCIGSIGCDEDHLAPRCTAEQPGHQQRRLRVGG